ncbi:MAG TPA: hypothetical protein VFJ51_02810, partial [Nitrososphaeraceae archaeon]|nr:hypothetical protein [Nitrososphaeraceae archaeon]
MVMAQNNTTTTTSPTPALLTATATKTNPSITLGNPIFIEHDKSTPLKPVVVNGIHGFQASYSGSGVVKGINFSDNGTVLIVPRSKGASDLSGHTIITTTSNGEKGTYTFYSIGHTDANGTTRDNGAAFFHTNSSGKLGTVNNLVVVFKDQIEKAGNGMTIGWEWK